MPNVQRSSGLFDPFQLAQQQLFQSNPIFNLLLQQQQQAQVDSSGLPTQELLNQFLAAAASQLSKVSGSVEVVEVSLFEKRNLA